MIADYHLGTEDGLAVVASLRKLYPNTQFPVIMITGDTTSAGMQTLQNSGHHVLHMQSAGQIESPGDDLLAALIRLR